MNIQPIPPLDPTGERLLAGIPEPVSPPERYTHRQGSEAAKTFAERAELVAPYGIPVVPILPRDKRAFLNDWQELATTDPNQLEKWNRENPAYNCGAVARKDGFCFFEVDDPAIYKEIANETRHSLKELDTLVVKSSGAKRHFYFKHNARSETVGNVDGDNEDGAEQFSFRAHDRYVVGPGSIHRDTGKSYEIVHQPTFGDIPATPDWLLDWIENWQRNHKPKTKAASPALDIIAEGGRNKTLTSLAGTMRRRGMAEPEILAALVAVNQNRCRPPLSASELEQIAASVAKYDPAEPRPEAHEPQLPTEEATITEELPDFPAITGSIQELIGALAPDLPREFKIMAAVTRIGLALSGKVHLEGEPYLQPRFYTCLVAPPGTGKTAVIKETRPLKFDCREIPSVDSAPALIDALAEEPGKPLLLNADEAVDLFEKGKTSRDGRNSLFAELLKLYEDTVTGNRARRNEAGPIEITDGRIAVLCGATPSGYDSMWIGSRGATGGLQSRFTTITTTALRLPVKQHPSDKLSVEAAVERIRRQIEASEPTLLTITAEAEDAFAAWWAEVPKDNVNTTRAEDMVKRFLMVLAVTNDVDTIGLALMRTGIAFGDYLIRVRDLFNPADASSWVQAFEQKIVKCFERHGVMTRDRCRKLIRPDRYPGGYGDFVRAFKNLTDAGRLTKQGESERAVKWGLA